MKNNDKISENEDKIDEKEIIRVIQSLSKDIEHNKVFKKLLEANT